MDDEKLIECVREFPALYDMGHPKYLDSNYKISLWKRIGQELKKPDLTCKKRWINIRDQFRKSLNRRKSGQLTDTKIRKYKYEEMLIFLMPYIQERITVSSVEEQASNDSGIENLQSTTFSNTCGTGTQQWERNITNITDEPFRKKIKTASPETVSSHLMNNIEDNRNQGKHPIDAFLEGLAPTLKNFPPYYQHLAKGRIFSVIQEIESQAFFGSHTSRNTQYIKNFRSCDNDEQK